MAITAKQVKKLRDKTGAGVMATKKALEATDGDEAKAEKILFEEGVANASKRVGRTAAEGVISTYVHSGGKIASMIQLQCETDFVASSQEFKTLAYDLAMQVAAMAPKFLSKESSKEEEEVLDSEILLEQKFIKDSGLTIDQKIKELISKVGENIYVSRFERFSV